MPTIAELGAGAAGLAALYGAMNPDSKIGEFMGAGSSQQPIGYTGGIPEYEVNRSLVPNAFATTTPTGEPRRPGSGGRRYFTDTTYTPTGNTMGPATAPVVADPQTEAITAWLTSTFGSGAGAGAGTQTGTGAGTGTQTGTGVAGTSSKDLAYRTFLAQFAGKQLTDKDLLTLRSSGYDVNKLATDLGITASGSYTPATRLTSGTQGAESRYATTLANQIRTGGATPATAATTINTLYPGYNMNEESVVFELLNRGLTTPQEVANYYADSKAYTVEDILARYNQLGGTQKFAQGGLASLAPSRGYYLGGSTDGMADRIPATIENREPAALSDGEFVVPADVVSHLGNGNSDAGANQLYSMMDRIRQARTGRKEQGRQINPNKYIPV